MVKKVKLVEFDLTTRNGILLNRTDGTKLRSITWKRSCISGALSLETY